MSGRPLNPPTTAELFERFVSRVRLTPTGCWMWTGGTNGRYGQFRVYEVVVYAHRFAYEGLVGPIPKGLTIDHLCRNKLCVNPQHLEPVTLAENARRGAVKTHCKHGHELAVHAYFYRGQRRCGTCARERARETYRRKKAANSELGAITKAGAA
jgi:hypothetical protein